MKRALISVTDKTNIVVFAKQLINLGYEIISTGGTMKTLIDNNISCMSIDSVTNFPEMLDGRVKTLHPMIHGGLLYRRDLKQHVDTINEYNIKAIDMVVCNLYEFEKNLHENKPLDIMIENIDIGGPSMIRSAAKNYKDVLVVTDINDYDTIIEKLTNNTIDYKYHEYLAYKAFSLTASYDTNISRYFSNLQDIRFPDTLNISLKKKEVLRYGENSHQDASLYHDTYIKNTLLDYKKLHGKEISFNNVNDLYCAVAIIREFKDVPVCAAIKHSTPCGVSTGNNIYDAYTKTYNADPLSIFGGIIAVNGIIDEDTATKMNEIFLEIIAAVGYTDKALEILKQKKNLRILELNNYDNYESNYDIKYLEGEVLVQDLNKEFIKDINYITNNKPTNEQLKDMEFGMKIVKYCKSNAICIVKDQTTLAIGQGQTSRVWALQNAINNNPDKDFNNATLASDAFFPFADCAEIAHKAGINNIIQPGGSIKDQDTIDYCNENNMSMVFTGYRHFRH